MFPRSVLLTYFFLAFTSAPLVLIAQKHNTVKTEKKSTPYKKDALFNTDDILHCKITGNLNALFKDRSDNSGYHPLLLQYFKSDSSLVSVNLQAKTRGHFRRLKSNCKMPPLLLDFTGEVKRSPPLFSGQQKLKLIVPCQGDDYVIKEWLVYKLYNLISKSSFKARLALVDFEDSLNPKKSETHYCFLLEDEKQMAKRNDCFVWKRKMLDMRNTNLDEFRKMAVFQYMIGNTDWGVPYLQNIVLITEDSLMAPVTVPYDFDHAGIVDASYAAPAPELELPSIRDRLYRGFCEKDISTFKKTFDLFNTLKDDIYNLYSGCTLLNSKYQKFVKNYLDDFYKTINNNRSSEIEFTKPCRSDVHVEIKGLKK